MILLLSLYRIMKSLVQFKHGRISFLSNVILIFSHRIDNSTDINEHIYIETTNMALIFDHGERITFHC